MVKIRFTYDVVTEESAQDGDTADNGWFIPGMGKFPVEDDTAAEYMEVRAKEAVWQINQTVGGIDSVQMHGDTATFYPSDRDQDYRTGEDTSYYAHIEADPRLIRAIVKALGCEHRVS